MRAFRYLSVVLIGWTASAILAEAAFRLTGDRPTFDLKGLYEPFGSGGYKLRPNVDTEAYWASGKLAVHTDGLGLRTDEARRFGTMPGALLDVLLIGDSQGFGNGLSFEESLAGTVAMRAAGDGFTVGNASVGGHSVASQVDLVVTLLERHRVRARRYVILLTPQMIHTCDERESVVVGEDGRLYQGAISPSTQARLWIKTNLVLYARVRDAIRNRGIGVNPATDTPWIFQLYGTGAAESESEERLYGCIEGFQKLAERARGAIDLVYVPLTIEADFESIRRAAELRGLNIDREAPTRVSLAVSRRLGVPFHTLRPSLDLLHEGKEELHLVGDFHYSRALSLAASADLWQALEKELVEEEPAAANRAE